jgi:hypothetical protein
LVLAHRIDGMIRAGEIRDWAEAARLTGVTRARMTQIANLSLLAPPIQALILDYRHIATGTALITERTLRTIAHEARWAMQLRFLPPSLVFQELTT